jgi:hypothetical protein
MGLGEVNASTCGTILADLNDPSLSLLDWSSSSGRIKFDTAILYDRNQLGMLTHRSFVDEYARGSLKLGELTMFEALGTGKILNVVVSHWPSPRYAAEFSAKRDELGTLMRQSLEELRRADPDVYLVLMGDFNADPYSKTLSQHLLATRDRKLAARDPRYLYNPFWRCLGESYPIGHPDAESSICGTFFYPSGDHTQWFTFDQIMFSSSFLREGPMLLVEEYSRIIATPVLRNGLSRKEPLCDHFPVLSLAKLRKPL